MIYKNYWAIGMMLAILSLKGMEQQELPHAMVQEAPEHEQQPDHAQEKDTPTFISQLLLKKCEFLFKEAAHSTSRLENELITLAKHTESMRSIAAKLDSIYTTMQKLLSNKTRQNAFNTCKSIVLEGLKNDTLTITSLRTYSLFHLLILDSFCPEVCKPLETRISEKHAFWQSVRGVKNIASLRYFAKSAITFKTKRYAGQKQVVSGQVVDIQKEYVPEQYQISQPESSASTSTSTSTTMRSQPEFVRPEEVSVREEIFTALPDKLSPLFEEFPSYEQIIRLFPSCEQVVGQFEDKEPNGSSKPVTFLFEGKSPQEAFPYITYLFENRFALTIPVNLFTPEIKNLIQRKNLIQPLIILRRTHSLPYCREQYKENPLKPLTLRALSTLKQSFTSVFTSATHPTEEVLKPLLKSELFSNIPTLHASLLETQEQVDQKIRELKQQAAQKIQDSQTRLEDFREKLDSIKKTISEITETTLPQKAQTLSLQAQELCSKTHPLSRKGTTLLEREFLPNTLRDSPFGQLVQNYEMSADDLVTDCILNINTYLQDITQKLCHICRENNNINAGKEDIIRHIDMLIGAINSLLNFSADPLNTELPAPLKKLEALAHSIVGETLNGAATMAFFRLAKPVHLEQAASHLSSLVDQHRIKIEQLMQEMEPRIEQEIQEKNRLFQQKRAALRDNLEEEARKLAQDYNLQEPALQRELFSKEAALHTIELEKNEQAQKLAIITNRIQKIQHTRNNSFLRKWIIYPLAKLSYYRFTALPFYCIAIGILSKWNWRYTLPGTLLLGALHPLGRIKTSYSVLKGLKKELPICERLLNDKKIPAQKAEHEYNNAEKAFESTKTQHVAKKAALDAKIAQLVENPHQA